MTSTPTTPRWATDIRKCEPSTQFQPPKKKMRPGKTKAEGQKWVAKMPQEYKGPCCGGTKKWGDGKGCNVDGKIEYYCYACNCILDIILTDEEKARAAKNKEVALARRAARIAK